MFYNKTLNSAKSCKRKILISFWISSAEGITLLYAFQTNISILFIYFNIIFVAAIAYITFGYKKLLFLNKAILKKTDFKRSTVLYFLILRRNRLILHVLLTRFEICGSHLKHIDLWSLQDDTSQLQLPLVCSEFHKSSLVKCCPEQSSWWIKAKCEQVAPFYKSKWDVLGFFNFQR